MKLNAAPDRFATSRGSVALKSEYDLLVPIAAQITAMYKRAERAHARLESRELLNIRAAYDALTLLVDDMGKIEADIEALMDGQVGLGPAVACRNALQHIRASLPALPRKGTS